MTAATNVTKLEEKAVDNTVQRPAPSAERKPFKVVENRYSPENATKVLAGAEAFLTEREKTDQPWLMNLRRECLAFLQERGLPTPRLERWKYTRLNGFDELLVNDAKGSEANDIEAAALPEALSPLRMVFVDGAFRQDLSQLPTGLNACGCVSDLQDHESVQALFNNAPLQRYNDQMQWALNGLYTRGGAVIDVPKNMIMEHPIEVLYVSTQASTFMPRTLIALGENAQATVIERYADLAGAGQGANAKAVNAACSIRVDANARMTHHKLHTYHKGDMALGTTHVTQARDSHYEAYDVSASAEDLNRQQIWVQLQGENAETFLNGVQLSRGHQQLETSIHMDHEAPHCTSNQDYRHIAAENSSCNFQGKVQVHQIAQKTEAYQMSRGVVLSDRAEVNTKPELEIYADDVRCSHGATTGQIDEDALFYMRGRGLRHAEARRMLLTSFAAEVFEMLGDENPVADQHLDIMTKWLSEVLA